METTMKKGQYFTLAMPGHPLNGRLVEHMRQSKQTGDCTVKLIQGAEGPGNSAYKPGDVIQVKRSELRNLGKVYHVPADDLPDTVNRKMDRQNPQQ